MKSLAIVFSAVLLVSTATAQRGGGGHSGGSHTGGGFSGGGHAGGGFSGGGRSGGGGFHNGGGAVGGHGGYWGGRSYGRSYATPYAGTYFAPAYGYGFAPSGASDYGSVTPAYNYGYSGMPPMTDQPQIDYGPQGGQPLPPPDEDTIRMYQAPAPTPQEAAMSEGRYYLIAYKDHSVYTALAYWMENGALNYVTPQNSHNQVSLDLLDLDLTKQLNSRRGLAFNLIGK